MPAAAGGGLQRQRASGVMGVHASTEAAAAVPVWRRLPAGKGAVVPRPPGVGVRHHNPAPKLRRRNEAGRGGQGGTGVRTDSACHGAGGVAGRLQTGVSWPPFGNEIGLPELVGMLARRSSGETVWPE